MKKSQFLVLCTLTVVIISLVVRIQLQERDSKPSRDLERVASVTSKLSPSRVVRKVAPPRPSMGSDALTVHATGAHPDHPEVQDAQASRIEMRARDQLARLHENLQLSKDQQRRIYPILVRNDPEFQASMPVGSERPAGSAGTSIGPGFALAPASRPLANTDLVDKENSQFSPKESAPVGATDPSEAIMRELSPEQQAAYEVALIDEGLWWADIIGQIESEYNRSRVVPDILEDEGAGENLFDLIGK